MYDFQPLLDKWQIDCKATTLLRLWNAPHRAFHTTAHLDDLVRQIQRHQNLTTKRREMLLLIALFHDLVYDPQRADNELQSAEFLLDCARQLTPDIFEISYCILDTQQHAPASPFSALFCEMDMDIVTRPLEDLLEWEKGIAYEYSFLPVEEYIQKRTAFLDRMIAKYPQNAPALTELVAYVRRSASRALVV